MSGMYLAFVGLWVIPFLRDAHAFSDVEAGGIVSLFSLGFIGFRFSEIGAYDNLMSLSRLGKNQLIAANEIETLKEIERRLARFSLKVDLEAPLYCPPGAI